MDKILNLSSKRGLEVGAGDWMLVIGCFIKLKA
jgi:hypothetical protein